MARVPVPVYDGPQVGLKPVQFDRADADQFGAAQGRTMERIGSGLSAAADAIDKRIDRETLSEVQDAEYVLKTDYEKWALDAASTRLGGKAKDIALDAADWWKTNGNERLAQMTTATGQNMLRRVIEQQSLAGRRQFAAFENNQLEADLQQKTKANVESSIKLAVSNPSPESVELQANAVRNALKLYGASRWAPEVLEQEQDAAVARLYGAVFNTMFVQSPAQARDFYAANRDAFDPLRRDELEARLKTGLAISEGAQFARTAVAEFTTRRKLTDPYPVQEIEKRLVERFGDAPEKLAAARVEADRAKALWNQQQSETTAAAVNTVMDALSKPGGNINDVKRLDAWENLTGQQRAAIEERYLAKIEAQQRQRDAAIDRAERREARAERDLEKKLIKESAPIVDALLGDPEKLAGMSAADLANLRPQIGDTHYKELLAAQKKWKSDIEALRQAKADNEAFTTFMTQAGYSMKDKDLKPFVLEMRNRVEARLAAAQVAGGKKLTPGEAQKLMKEVIFSQVLTDTMFGGTKKVSEWEMTDPDQIRKARVVFTYTDKDGAVKEGTYKIGDIPKDEYDRFATALTRTEGVATQRRIVEMWYAFKSRGKR